MFEGTKSSSLAPFHEEIKNYFGIDWSVVIWEDLRKPLYSGLAARLYMQWNSGGVSIGTSVEEQATYWVAYYRENGDKQTFIDRVGELDDSK